VLVRINVADAKSVASKAAEGQEGQPQSKTLRATCRYIHSDRFWTAAVLLPLLSRKLTAIDNFDQTHFYPLLASALKMADF